MIDDQLELFVADIIDVKGRSDMETMEFPLFSVSKRADMEMFRFEDTNRGLWVEVLPSAIGRANVFDKDLLIYCLGQLTEAKNRGRIIHRKIQITPRDFMVSTGKSAGGKEYTRMHDSLTRLRGTTIRTNIGDKTSQRGEVFGLIEQAQLISENGRTVSVEITLSERLFDAITERKVLAYNPDYFKLNSPVYRRLYEICRKHCGTQPLWEVSLDKLYNKVGSKSTSREFKRVLKNAERDQPIPQYFIGLEDSRSNAKFYAMYDKDGEMKKLHFKEMNDALASSV